MKIVYFGVFEKPYDTEVYISNTLESLGHTVEKYPTNQVTLGDVHRILAEKPDFILFSKGMFENKMEIKRAIKESGILTVGWFFDLAIGTLREKQVFNHQIFEADIVFTTDGGHQKEFEKYGVNHHLLRQGIYEPEAYLGEPDWGKAGHEIAFVGTSNHDIWFKWKHRQELIEWLGNTYKERFGWYGANDGVRNSDLNELYATAKIVVGDSVVSPNYWSNRLYETLGRGGFLIFPNVPGIENEFIPYKHFIPYEPYDWEGLKEKIDYYLTHDEEREKIRLAGFEHCKKYHTYTKRCEEMIRQINEYKGLSA